MEKNPALLPLAKLFLKLGFTAFGGPAAHIAMLHQEVVTKRKWLDEQHFLDLIGATNLIPGPNSTEMVMHVGQERAGWKGLVVAGLCFILPAVCITGILAWLYQKYGALPEVLPFIYGIKPTVIAVIVAAIYPLAKKSLKSVGLAAIGIVVLVLSLLGYNEIFLMFAAGFLAMLWHYFNKNGSATVLFPLLLIEIQQPEVTTNWKLFFIFLKIGAILYGSGYVLFAFLDAELVSTGLLSREQLIDAIAVGQFTPGPVFSAVTFVGYQINGASGALVATVAVFLPSFFFVALLNPMVKKMRNSVLFGVFLDAVNMASIAIILAVCIEMSKTTVTDWRMLLIAISSLVLLFRFPSINSAFIVLGGAVAGYLLLLL